MKPKIHSRKIFFSKIALGKSLDMLAEGKLSYTIHHFLLSLFILFFHLLLTNDDDDDLDLLEYCQSFPGIRN
jgi:hypothetical protein